jgi:hypothetical protein
VERFAQHAGEMAKVRGSVVAMSDTLKLLVASEIIVRFGPSDRKRFFTTIPPCIADWFWHLKSGPKYGT